MRTKTIIALVFFILIVIFSLQNSNQTAISLLVWSFSIPTVLLILSCFSLGLLVGILVSFKKEKPKTNPDYRNDKQ